MTQTLPPEEILTPEEITEAFLELERELNEYKNKVNILIKTLEGLKRGCSLSAGCPSALGQECNCGGRKDTKKINEVLELIK